MDALPRGLQWGMFNVTIMTCAHDLGGTNDMIFCVLLLRECKSGVLWDMQTTKYHKCKTGG